MQEIKRGLVEDWTEIIPRFIKIPWTIYKYRHPFYHYWKVGLVKVKLGKTNIIILGKPLAGKTEFMNYLTGEASKISYAKKGTSFDTEDSVVSFGNWSKILRTVPGQKIIGKNRYEELNKSFGRNNNLEGIIYTVDYGYTDLRDDALKEKKVSEDEISLSELRKKNLLDEVSDFNEICLKIEESDALGFGPKWIIILVNKADLFANKFSEVQNYYSIDGENDFAQRLRQLKKNIGENHIKIYTLPISSYPETFTWGDEKVNTNIGGVEKQKALLKNLIFTVNFLDVIT